MALAADGQPGEPEMDPDERLTMTLLVHVEEVIDAMRGLQEKLNDLHYHPSETGPEEVDVHIRDILSVLQEIRDKAMVSDDFRESVADDALSAIENLQEGDPELALYAARKNLDAALSSILEQWVRWKDDRIPWYEAAEISLRAYRLREGAEGAIDFSAHNDFGEIVCDGLLTRSHHPDMPEGIRRGLLDVNDADDLPSDKIEQVIHELERAIEKAKQAKK
jgi:hypothetical protein